MDKGQTRDDFPLRHPPHFPNAAFDIVALAASAGGLSALSRLLAALPADVPGAVVVV
jgi:two-component system chemotaxis response regulator CheB